MSYSEFDTRMKQYEKVYTEQKIVPHIPTIMRIDGKCFHNFTKGCDKPFDKTLWETFQISAQRFYNIFHYDFAYGQSDEISFLFYRPNTRSQEDFEGKLFKLCSVGASGFTSLFNAIYLYEDVDTSRAIFDCRVFLMPKEEVIN